jgi:hypothetical protein
VYVRLTNFIGSSFKASQISFHVQAMVYADCKACGGVRKPPTTGVDPEVFSAYLRSIRDWRQLPRELWTAQCTDDSRRCRRTRQVDGLYPCMGKRTSDKRRMQHLRQLKIGDESSATGQQALVFTPRNGATDKGNIRKIIHS